MFSDAGPTFTEHAARIGETGYTRPGTVPVIGEHTALDEVEGQDDDVGEGSVDGHDERQRQQPLKPKTGRSLAVRQAAARAAVTASKKTGRPVYARVQKLADSR